MNKLINSPQNTGKTEPLAYIDATIKAGYEGIGIRSYRAPGRNYNFNPIVGNKDLERDVKNALKDSGLEVYDLYSFYLQPEMQWDLVKPALDFGGEIGCKFVLIIGDDPDWNRMLDTMGKMIDHIEPLGMKAVIEDFATALTPLSTCIKFVNDCKPRYVGHCLDPRQGYRDEKGFGSLKDLDLSLVPYVQLNDTAINGAQGVLPGEGYVPLYDYLDALPLDIDISTEAQMPPGNVYTGAEWSKITVERIHRFLERYRFSKQQAQAAR
ncbi:MAG TPA: TIM barrel protein [Chloroflexota bacterium]|jgi:sugar phosphate isomerase/epimerase|nr:TIM barrel protein [Chloroflexota bacterium]